MKKISMYSIYGNKKDMTQLICFAGSLGFIDHELIQKELARLRNDDFNEIASSVIDDDPDQQEKADIIMAFCKEQIPGITIKKLQPETPPSFRKICVMTFTGPPGCGKTQVAKKVKDFIKEQGWEVLSFDHEPEKIVCDMVDKK